MLRKDDHLSDQELLSWVDGEVSARRAAGIQRHLSACGVCRPRMAELQHTIADFVHIYGSELGAELPPMEGPRALLKARLKERAAAAEAVNWFGGPRRFGTAGAVAALLLLAGIAIWVLPHGMLRGSVAIPDLSLTPGATNPIGVQDVCATRFSSNDPAVPDTLKREVLKAYGLNGDMANAYEIDYLVTPELGGATSIRNLWPQPSLNTVWNARVKDALEDRLHNMVCSGQLDLATAQREISQDWVAAYKKYFRTNEPFKM
jgi:hypothetical protein